MNYRLEKRPIKHARIKVSCDQSVRVVVPVDEEIQLKWYRQEARRLICNRVEELAKRHRFSYNKVFIRGQKTKWENCSKDKNLSFNWRLIKAPERVIDYIVIHELLHTETMNHSRNFWLKMKMLYPEYKQAIGWLERYGVGLCELF